MGLKEDIKSLFRSEIKHAKDCQILSNEIVEFTGRNISTATLRRYFGLLDSSSKLSKYNEETLELYRLNKKEFIKGVTKKNNSFQVDTIKTEVEELSKIYGGLNEKLIDHIVNGNYHFDKIFTLICDCMHLAYEKKNLDFFKLLYRQSTLLIGDPQFCRELGKLLDNNKPFSEEVLANLSREKRSRKYFFEFFINFSHFKTYKKSLQFYFKDEPDYLNKLWAISLLIYGEILSNGSTRYWEDYEEIWELKYSEIFDSHPYLKARVLGVGLVNQKLREKSLKIIEQELEKENKDYISDKNQFPSFSSILYQYLLIFNAPHIIVKKLLINLNQYKPIYNLPQDAGIHFYPTLCNLYLNGGTLNPREIFAFNSGHINEDAPIKLYAYKYLTDYSVEAEAYQKELLRKSGFECIYDLEHLSESLNNKSHII